MLGMSEHTLKSVRVVEFSPSRPQRVDRLGWIDITLRVLDDGTWGNNRLALHRICDDSGRKDYEVTFYTPDPEPVWGSCMPKHEVNTNG